MASLRLTAAQCCRVTRSRTVFKPFMLGVYTPQGSQPCLTARRPRRGSTPQAKGVISRRRPNERTRGLRHLISLKDSGHEMMRRPHMLAAEHTNPRSRSWLSGSTVSAATVPPSTGVYCIATIYVSRHDCHSQ